MPIKATFTGDVTDLRRSTEQARQEFRKVGTEAEGAARQLKAVGSSFDGSRLEGAARRAASSIERIGGVARLTDSEIAKNSRTISELLQKYERMGVEAPANIRRLATELQNAAGAARNLETASSGIGASLKSGFGALAGGLGIGLGAGAGLAAISAIGGAIRDMAADAAKLGPLSQAFERLQGGAASASRTLDAMRTSTRGLVANIDLMRASNQATQLGLTAMGVDMSKLAGAAVTLGRAVGNEATQSIDDLIGALGRGSTEVLDNLGITLRVAEAQEIYAERLGKTTTQLTDQEKKQAFVTIGMERAVEKAAALGEVTLTAADHVTRITNALTGMGTEAAAAANKWQPLVDALERWAAIIEKLRSGGRLQFADMQQNAMAQGGVGGLLVGGAMWATAGTGGREAIGAAQERRAAGVSVDEELARIANAGEQLEAWRTGLATTTDVVAQFQAQLAAGAKTAAPLLGVSKSAIADLAEAKQALAALTAGQREQIAAAKELGKSNKEAAEAAGTTEAVVKLYEAMTAGAKKATDQAAKLREEFAKLSGEDAIRDAERYAAFVLKMGDIKLPTAQVDVLAQKFMDAAKAAREAGRAISQDVVDALNSLEIKSKRIVGLNPLFIQGSINRAAQNAIDTAARTTGSLAGFTGQISSTNPFQYVALQQAATVSPLVQEELRKAKTLTRDWRVELTGVAEAFARLAQIAGPSLSGVTRGIGTTIASIDTATQLVNSLADLFPSLQTRDAQGNNLAMSGRGRALQAGFAGLSVGLQLGQFQTNLAQAFATGALGGAASGGLATGTWAGAGIGFAVGGVSAILAASQNRKAQQQAIQDQRLQILAQMGGLDELQRRLRQAAIPVDQFMRLFQSTDVDEFARAVTWLNTNLPILDQRASALAKSLASVASVQGVLSPQQLQEMRRLLAQGPGPGTEAIVEFADQQRAQAEGGLTSAIAALTPSLTDAEIENLTRGISDAAERARVIEAELARRSRETLDRFGMGAQAAASGLFVAFSEAVRQGESAISVLTRLKKPIQDLQQLYARAGQTPGAGFQNLQVLSDIATGPQTGPAVQLAQGLGQALAGFANTGLLSPALFGELANGIGQAYKQLELFGKGGLEAARLMQPSLQTIWQMIQDNPKLRDELDDTTLALLDFAEQNGLVGDKFRPAIDQMIRKLDELITRIGELIDSIAGVPPIDVPVTYTNTQDEFPAPPPKPPRKPGLNYDGTPDNDGDPSTPMALGGIVTRPTRALIGEAGPEAVIPLSRLGRFGTPIQITVISQIDGYEAARAITRYQPDVYRTYGAA